MLPEPETIEVQIRTLLSTKQGTVKGFWVSEVNLRFWQVVYYEYRSELGEEEMVKSCCLLRTSDYWRGLNAFPISSTTNSPPTPRPRNCFPSQIRLYQKDDLVDEWTQPSSKSS